MKTIYMLFFTLTVSLLNAQINNSYTFSEKILDMYEAKLFDPSGLELDLSKIEGSPYLTNDFLDGKIINTETGETMALPLRYNSYTDQIETIRANSQQVGAIVESKRLIIFIKKDKFIFMDKVDFEGLNKSGYLVELLPSEKGYGLLLKYRTSYIPEIYGTTPLQQGEPAKFKTFEILFIKEGNRIIKLPKKKGSFMQLFGNEMKKVKNYMKDNNLNFKKQRDLLRIIYYYNSL